MDTLRRRTPFKIADDDEEPVEDAILDEEQQDALIESLRNENEIMNCRYSFALKMVVGLSFTLLLTNIGHNPLFAIFPIEGPKPSLPLPAVFTLLAIFIHANLALLFCSDDIKARLQLPNTLKPLSYQLLYLLSAVAPTISLFLRKPWQITVWWCITPIVVVVVQTILDAVQQSIQGIADLENMKYTAPGA